MSYSPKDIEGLAKRMRMNLTALQGQLSDLMKMFASLPFPEERESPSCPHCGELASVQNERQLAEHMENVHGRIPDDPPNESIFDSDTTNRKART